MEKQITKDEAYNTVSPDDFQALLEVERYGERTDAFDKIISATHDHFWDPLDDRYISFEDDFDMKTQMILPEEMMASLRTNYVQSRLNDQEKIELGNEVARWMISSILHGEQGALSLSASLCHILRDPGAQEYAANQAREEARHVTAFTKYIEARWGSPAPVGETLGTLLNEMVTSEAVYKKIVGMQMLVEGLAMGAFATFHTRSQDPLLKHLTQLVMTDEAFHHKFGKIWADRTVPHLSEDERNTIEDWAAHCFQTLLFNLVNPEQMKDVYAKFGLDYKEIMAEFATMFGDESRREQMQQSTNIFRVLIKTLVKAGIITDRTRSFYSAYVDMDELKGEGDEMVGDEIAEQGIAFLKTVNFRGAAVAAE